MIQKPSDCTVEDLQADGYTATEIALLLRAQEQWRQGKAAPKESRAWIDEWRASKSPRKVSKVNLPCPDDANPYAVLKYWKFLEYRRRSNLPSVDFAAYVTNHMGMTGGGKFGFKMARKNRPIETFEPGPRKRIKLSPNPVCVADIKAIAVRAKQIVEEKLRRVA